jgi:hypothetical protein
MAAFSLATGCGGPKTIPDDALGDIFRDIYMVNAYTPQASRIDYDSVDIYLPILQKYGYDTDDFLNTLAGFSKRKSAKISGIVDNAIAKLNRSADSLSRKVATLDYIDSIAWAETKTEVYRDSLITIRGKADSAAMELKLPASEGRYGITYYYTLDSLDGNRNLANRHYIRDSLGRILSNNLVRLRPSGRTLFSEILDSPEYADSLELTFGNYPPNPKRMHLTIDSLVIEYYPPREEVLEKILRSYIDPSTIVKGSEYYERHYFQADSSTLHILPPEAAPEPDTLAVE